MKELDTARENSPASREAIAQGLDEASAQYGRDYSVSLRAAH